MATTYPPLSPTLTGDNLAISRFLNSPTMVQRRLRTLADQRYVADVLLTGRIEASGGAILYGVSESIYTDRAPEVVAPGSNYPQAQSPTGTAALAGVSKWGQEIPITDEEVGRTNRQAVDRSLLKAINQSVANVDSLCLAAIATGVTATQAAAAAWSNASADPFGDIAKAVAKVTDLGEGYDPDTVVLTDALYALLVSNQKIIGGLRRESTNTITETGDITRLVGLAVRPVPSSRMPSGTSILVLDSTQLGSLGFERIPSPEFSGDPANGVESSIRRDPAADRWLIKTRRPVVPIVQEPACAVKVTGA